MRGLYAIVDVTSAEARGVDPVGFASAIVQARPASLQLRAKDLPPREFLALLRQLVPLCRRFGIPLIANDRADLAALAGCDIVHIGQEDMPIAQVRRLAPGIRIGVSTHTLAELSRALKDRPDYVAYGPVFATSSKAKADATVGLEGLSAAAAQVAGTNIPLVAIGGITLESAPAIASRASAGAVIAALYTDEPMNLAGVTEHARRLHAALCGEGDDEASTKVAS
jgi:thiamine-phosphate pyrophosphorylase